MNVIAPVLTLVQLASFVLLPVILGDFPSPGLFKKERKEKKKAEEKSEELREEKIDKHQE